MANPCRAVETTHVQRFMDSPRAKAFRWPIGMEKFLVLVVEGFSPVCSGTGLCPFCSRAGRQSRPAALACRFRSAGLPLLHPVVLVDPASRRVSSSGLRFRVNHALPYTLKNYDAKVGGFSGPGNPYFWVFFLSKYPLDWVGCFVKHRK